MDADIARWRGMGSSKLYSHPSKKLSLIKRKQKHKVTSGGKPSDNLPSKDLEYKAVRSPNKETLGEMMDRFVLQQRKEILDIASGYLNSSKANQILEKTAAKGASLFGKKKATPVKLLGDDNGIEVGVMHDMLEQYDPIKLKVSEEVCALPQELSLNSQIESKTLPKFLPPPQLHLTKLEEYNCSEKIDSSLIDEGRKLKFADKGKLSTLRKIENFIERELALLECSSKGPDLKRLRIFSFCFENIIQEFTTFGPLLANIKNEYDKIINSYAADDQEFKFLRSKVQKLIAQNENRLLLKFEKQKCEELEKRVKQLEADNNNLRNEMLYKFSIYAAYLPESVVKASKMNELGLTNNSNELFRPLDAGKDTLNTLDEAIAQRDEIIRQKVKEIELLREKQEADFVPRVTKEKLEENLESLEAKYQAYFTKSSDLEAQLAEKKERISQLEASLEEKEQEYDVLIKRIQ